MGWVAGDEVQHMCLEYAQRPQQLSLCCSILPRRLALAQNHCHRLHIGIHACQALAVQSPVYGTHSGEISDRLSAP